MWVKLDKIDAVTIMFSDVNLDWSKISLKSESNWVGNREKQAEINEKTSFKMFVLLYFFK